MKRYLLFLASFFLTHCVQSQQRSRNDSFNHVEIRFAEERNMFPESWYEKPISAWVTSLNKSEVKRSSDILGKAFKKYPENLINLNLNLVYVLNEINFYGYTYGGTYANSDGFRNIYICNKGVYLNYTDEYIEQTFHHEFSSILLQNYDMYFEKEAWMEANEEGFKYGTGGIVALKMGLTGMEFDPELNSVGILTEYSSASVEEDFNVFAQNIFKASPSFWETVESNPRLQLKLDIIVRFYHAIDSRFTKEFFKDISQR